MTSFDERGIKKKNNRKSVCSIEKWKDSGLWNEIVAEGEERRKNDMENVRLLHIPNTTPTGPKDPEPPPRFKSKK